MSIIQLIPVSFPIPNISNLHSGGLGRRRLIARASDQPDFSKFAEKCKLGCEAQGQVETSKCNKVCDLTMKFFSDNSPKINECIKKCEADENCALSCPMAIIGIDKKDYEGYLNVVEKARTCQTSAKGSNDTSSKETNMQPTNTNNKNSTLIQDKLNECVSKALNTNIEVVKAADDCSNTECLKQDTFELLTKCSIDCNRPLFKSTSSENAEKSQNTTTVKSSAINLSKVSLLSTSLLILLGIFSASV